MDCAAAGQREATDAARPEFAGGSGGGPPAPPGGSGFKHARMSTSAAAGAQDAVTAAAAGVGTAAAAGVGTAASSAAVAEVGGRTEVARLLSLLAPLLSEGSKQLLPGQAEVLVLAIMRTNLLLRGQPGIGKSWIMRDAAKVLKLLGRRVEPLTKFFGVTAHGQLWVDASKKARGMRQLARAAVICVDSAPAAPAAAAAFFAHLDFVARLARAGASGATRGSQRSPRSPRTQRALASADAGSDSDESAPPGAAEGAARAAAGGAAPEDLPFGGLQVLATQHEPAPPPSLAGAPLPGAAPGPPALRQVGAIVAPPAAARADPADASPRAAARLSVLVAHAAPPPSAAPSPHAALFALVLS